MQRVRQVLRDMFDQVSGLKTRINEEYVKSEEFEDLVDQTLRRVASERYEEKRRMYREVLTAAATDPVGSYDEQLRIVRTVEQLQPSHFRVLAVMIASGEPTLPGLRHRLGGMPHDLIVDIIDELTLIRK